MRATSIGHAGILIETDAGSIVCDPWFVPAFFGVVVRLPSQRPARRRAAGSHRIGRLPVSHPPSRRPSRRAVAAASTCAATSRSCFPDIPRASSSARSPDSGFTEFVRTTTAKSSRSRPGSRSRSTPRCRSPMAPAATRRWCVSDGHSRLVNQNDCRTTDLAALREHGPVDLHWLQYSGAIWYPMVYDLPDDRKRALCDAKVESQYARAMRYVEAIDARAVVPSAGPAGLPRRRTLAPQRDHAARSCRSSPTNARSSTGSPAPAGVGSWRSPAPQIEITPDGFIVDHPIPDDEVAAIFDDKQSYLRRYQADWSPWLDDLKRSWNPPSTDLLDTLAVVVGAAAAHGAHAVRRGRRQLPVPGDGRRRRARAGDRLPQGRGAGRTPASPTRSGSRSRGRWSRR